MKYVVDSNVFLDLLRKYAPVRARFNTLPEDTVLYLLQPVDYEVRRGLRHESKTGQLRFYESRVLPLIEWVELKDADWTLAVQFWLQSRWQGKQPDDLDLVIAAAAHRLDATVITADNLFDAIPVPHESWRET